ncbi:hypothetical protein X777_09639 [Ooceraea biroi]|uniref:Uncharacterized protein n=1 Tax=Ooceraea biroi TaxID=2015173 RepID=A0A026W9Z2_OOCBI|nr:hypothetical protein X777_09639 [Ooceraea biroi]
MYFELVFHTFPFVREDLTFSNGASIIHNATTAAIHRKSLLQVADLFPLLRKNND